MKDYSGEKISGHVWPLPKRKPKQFSTQMKNGAVLSNIKANGVWLPIIRMGNGTVMSLRRPIPWKEFTGEKATCRNSYLEFNDNGGFEQRDANPDETTNGGAYNKNWNVYTSGGNNGAGSHHPKGEPPNLHAFLWEKSNYGWKGLLDQQIEDLYILFTESETYRGPGEDYLGQKYI